jgi:thiol-disulfide isomerase/thioredoxin
MSLLDGKGDTYQSFATLKVALKAAEGSHTGRAEYIRKRYAEDSEKMMQQQRAGRIKLQLKKGNVSGVERAKLLDQLVTVTSKGSFGSERRVWEETKDYVKEIVKLDKNNRAGLKSKYEPILLPHVLGDQIKSGETREAYKTLQKILTKYTPGDTDKLQGMLVLKARLMMELSCKNGDVTAVLRKAYRLKPESSSSAMIKDYAKALKKPGASSWTLARFGSKLVKADGTEVDSSVLQGTKLIGIYLSASWCRPCRRFTPRLEKFRDRMKKEGLSFEVVLISRDRSKQDMMKYMSGHKMKWYAVPFESELRDELARRYGSRRIPLLVILDEKGNLISPLANMSIQAGDPIKTYKMWLESSK